MTDLINEGWTKDERRMNALSMKGIGLMYAGASGIRHSIHILISRDQPRKGLILLMALSNYERMLQLAEEVFAIRTDPEQLDVDEKVIRHLQQLHPATVSEHNDGKGPVVWILVIPTTLELMQQFLEKKISEKELYLLTPPDTRYEAIYLCSAMVLEEYRGKGIATQLTVDAIEAIRKEHPVQALFVWVFSKEGDRLAEKVARMTGLPLYKR